MIPNVIVLYINVKLLSTFVDGFNIPIVVGQYKSPVMSASEHKLEFSFRYSLGVFQHSYSHRCRVKYLKCMFEVHIQHVRDVKNE